MVSVAELKLDHVADGCGHNIWHEGVLRSAYDDGDDLVGLGCAMG
jgi:hypothetical protein